MSPDDQATKYLPKQDIVATAVGKQNFIANENKNIFSTELTAKLNFPLARKAAKHTLPVSEFLPFLAGTAAR